MNKRRIFLGILLTCFISCFVFSEEKASTEETLKNEEISLSEWIVSDKTEEEICEFINTSKLKKKELNAKDESGYSPLYLAIDSGKATVVEALLKKGADKNLISNITVRDKSGRKILRCSPVLYAAWKGDLNCLQVLVDQGAKINIESDFIIPTSSNTTYIRLLQPIDAAFYNRRNIDFNSVHKILRNKEIDYSHSHFSGTKWGYGKVVTHDLLKEYGLLEVK